MPIRTHRGRAAVYRRLWGWPLRSPKHLALAIVVLAVAAVGISLLLPDPPRASPPPDSGTSDTAASTSASSPVPETSASPPSITVPTTPPPDSPPDPAGVAVAEAWAKAWTHHPQGTTKQQWLDGLRPHTTPEFLPEMESVALANVPTAVTGRPKPTDSTAKTMTVRVPTDDGDIEIMLVNTPQGWRTASYDKVG